MKKILIAGDSFAADWTVKYNGRGWPNVLSEYFNVTNIAQAGCSEYKIWLQLSEKNIKKYDAIIVSHTSPNRIYVKKHPVHDKDLLHKNSDLIYSDLKYHLSKHAEIGSIVEFFENYFDLEYANFIHGLICDKINNYLESYNNKIIHISHYNKNELKYFTNGIKQSFESIKSQPGLINHYNEQANLQIARILKNIIED